MQTSQFQHFAELFNAIGRSFTIFFHQHKTLSVQNPNYPDDKNYENSYKILCIKVKNVDIPLFTDLSS